MRENRIAVLRDSIIIIIIGALFKHAGERLSALC
jgi:hypothetical protein